VAQDGVLDLDAPISDVLPYDVVHPAAPGVPITARMLAAHVSGIRDNWNVMDPLYVKGSDCPVALDGFLEAYFTPGGQYYWDDRNFYGDGPLAANRYSNLGAALGAMVVQSVTGTPFDAWTDEVIFTPLGMDSATWFLADSDPATLAVPYASRDGALEPLGHFGFVDWPSGQLRASAVDMARLLAAFMTDGGGVLDPSTNAAQREIQFPDLDESQGLLWYRWTLDGAEVWGHDGSEFGSATEIVARLEDGVGAVVLMNSEESLASLREVERAMFAAVPDL
jgi:CubicO group peptidase (beta-lactamase class C family)